MNWVLEFTDSIIEPYEDYIAFVNIGEVTLQLPEENEWDFVTLETLFKKTKKNVLNAMAGDKKKFRRALSDNLDISSVLVDWNLFINKKAWY